MTASHAVSALGFPHADDPSDVGRPRPGTLAIIQDGDIILEKGYGFRDREAQAPVTTAPLFNIGSFSKSFTALGVAQLVDQQKADLDAR